MLQYVRKESLREAFFSKMDKKREDKGSADSYPRRFWRRMGGLLSRFRSRMR